MKHLKLIGSRWVGYTGIIGGVEFKDAVSVDPVPVRIADRISAAIPMMELDSEGNEIGHAGVTNRLRVDAANRAPVVGPLKVQTEEERKAEELENSLKAHKAPTDKFYTGEELQDIASTGGIKALRVIAEPWNVRGKAIPALIEAIVGAQSRFLDGKPAVITAVLGEETSDDSEEEPVILTKEAKAAEELARLNAEEEDRVKAAAAAGDLAAAFEVKEEPADEMLIGSNKFAASYEIEGKTVTLGDLVVEAHKLSGASIAEWNALAEDDRDDLIRLELDRRLPKE